MTARGRVVVPAAPCRPRWPALLVLCLVGVASAATAVTAASGSDREACAEGAVEERGAGGCPAGPEGDRFDPQSLGRPLRPSDLRGPAAFGSYANSTLELPCGLRQAVAVGRVRQMSSRLAGGDEGMADFAVLPSTVNRSAVEDLLSLLRGYKDWDDDPDSVDGSELHSTAVLETCRRPFELTPVAVVRVRKKHHSDVARDLRFQPGAVRRPPDD